MISYSEFVWRFDFARYGLHLIGAVCDRSSSGRQQWIKPAIRLNEPGHIAVLIVATYPLRLDLWRCEYAGPVGPAGYQGDLLRLQASLALSNHPDYDRVDKFSGVNEMLRMPAMMLVASMLACASFAQTPTTPPTPGTSSSGAATAKPSAPSVVDIAATQFKDEVAAKAHCPTDTVVWLNPSSKVYYLAGSRYYGTTKRGAYTCKQDADHRGFRVARGELVKPAPPPTVTKP
jgi:hypothetical protein